MKNKSWNEKYELLKEYLEEHNGKYPSSKDVLLKNWIAMQRTIYNKGIKEEDGSICYSTHKLTTDQIDKLNSINFKWQNEFNSNWNKNYELLKEYLEEHNGKYPSSKEVYKGVLLGNWIGTQKKIYNKGNLQEDGSIRYGSSVLTKVRIDKLNSINFIWPSHSWKEKYNLLLEYLKEHNGKYPSSKEIYKDEALGQWVSMQRTIYNKGNLQEDGSIRYRSSILTKEQMEKINFLLVNTAKQKKESYSKNYELWTKNYELLKEYLKEHNGEYPSSKEIYKGVALSSWIYIQRQIYNNGELQEDGSIRLDRYTLTKEKINKLNEINFIWSNINENNFNKKYELLKEYLKEHNGKYPKRDEIYKGIKLGRWVNMQRTIYSNGTLDENGLIRYNATMLTKEQIEKLNKIGFIWIYYTERDYLSKIKSNKREEALKKKLLYRLKKVLEDSKNEIKEKEDIEKIEKEFVKTLTMFD